MLATWTRPRALLMLFSFKYEHQKKYFHIQFIYLSRYQRVGISVNLISKFSFKFEKKSQKISFLRSELEWITFNNMSEGLFLPCRESNPGTKNTNPNTNTPYSD